jgi:isoleucyl-tRNA synthetase
MELNFPKIEEEILDFWKKDKTFQKSIEKRKKAQNFVFYDGPITVNAKPGIHHVLARIFKDVIPRYKTMRGFRVERKNGWDTHGLPIELEVEKQLGFKTKKNIEEYGIAKFNRACKENVQKYIPLFRNLTERIGYWVDMDNPYVTYETDYIETLWFILKKIWDKKLLYKDYKVVPYCPRCETPLSSHEVAQGYQTVKEPAIYVKFKVKAKTDEWKNTSILVWTTTPWTLPANVALAINPKTDYICIPDYDSPDHWLVLGFENFKNLLKKEVFSDKYKKRFLETPNPWKGKDVDIFKGSEMVGLEYEPIFQFSKINKPAFRVIPASFVLTEEGTGIVHMAPAFGEDDMVAGKENDLPIILNVDKEGKFKKEVTPWSGKFVKEADPLITEELKKRNLLFKEEIHEHDYPFCWRCHLPLLYYAKESWWIEMTKIKDKLIKNNQKINWFPEYLKEGRFGEWLREVKDWAISRERYWGTPLPVWKCKKCGTFEVIGSLEELISQKFSKNEYYLLRHGESYWQTKYRKILLGWPEKYECPLTKKGRRDISAVAEKLRGKIDLIYSSDLLRTKQTAEIVNKYVQKEIVFDEILRDIGYGVLTSRKKEELRKLFPNLLDRFSKKIDNIETWSECKMRMFNFLKDIDSKHEGKRILIISHGDPLWLMEGAVKGLSNEEMVKGNKKQDTIKTANLRKVDAKFLPYDEEGNLNLHRPYIDGVNFYCKKCGKLMEREKEVVDVWFDSGAMPFGQAHWPFSRDQKSKTKSQKLTPPELFPAEYIAEAIDQTRGWFYTLLAISTLLGFRSPYENVVCLGHVLDEKGEKMSKSKGNVADPWQIIGRYGTDAVRWYFYTVNQPGDSKLFSESEVSDCVKRFLLILWNCWVFFGTYGKRMRKAKKTLKNLKSNNVLDKWIVSRVNNLIFKVTKFLDNYDIVSAARKIEGFVIEDLSQWYIRRSRRRLQKPEEKKEFKEASFVLNYVLLNLVKVTAPFTPFLSEEIFKNLGGKKSVHLEDWPEFNRELINKKLEEKMGRVREIVNLGLKERARLGIKIRQPLLELAVGTLAKGLESDLSDLIREEINVKNFRYDANLKGKIRLDERITPELKEEGMLREIIRQIQETRKETGLKPKDKILLQFFGSENINEIISRNKELIFKETKAKDVKIFKDHQKINGAKKETKVNEEKLWLGIKKV